MESPLVGRYIKIMVCIPLCGHLTELLFSKPAVFGAVGVDGCLPPCPPEKGWGKQSENCLYDGRMRTGAGAGIWKVIIPKCDEMGDGENTLRWRPKYTYAQAKAKCSAWGATLVREQDALNAVRFLCQLGDLTPITYMEFADNDLD